MSLRRRIASFFPAALLLMGPAAQADPIRIGVIGDQTGTSDLDAAYMRLEQAVTALNGRDLDLVLHTGDLLESSRPEDDIRADWARARALLDSLDAPWFLTPGDHDVNPPDRVANSSDRSREALFQGLLSEADPDAAQGFFRVRDVNGWRVIALYSHEALHADPRWGDVFLARLSDAQLGALDAALAAAPAPEGALVFLHQPLWYNWAGWEDVHTVLAEHGVDLVIAGHTHYDQIETPLDGVTYLVVGAAGGSTKAGSAHGGALHHVTEIVLGEGEPRLEIIPLDPVAPQSFTPRAAMDRVQAVAVMLGSSRFSRSGAIRLEGEACDTLVVPALGAPTDMPLTLDIRAEDHALEEVRFRPGACLESAGASCLMAPAYGVARANTSSVVLSERDPRPVFEARVTPPPGEALDLVIEARFSHAGETYALEEPIRLTPDCPSAP